MTGLPAPAIGGRRRRRQPPARHRRRPADSHPPIPVHPAPRAVIGSFDRPKVFDLDGCTARHDTMVWDFRNLRGIYAPALHAGFLLYGHEANTFTLAREPGPWT